MFNVSMEDDVFWSDSSKDEDLDAPELTSTEESADSSDSDDLPDLVKDPKTAEEAKEELKDSVSGQSGRWLSARRSWWSVPRRH